MSKSMEARYGGVKVVESTEFTLERLFASLREAYEPGGLFYHWELRVRKTAEDYLIDQFLLGSPKFMLTASLVEALSGYQPVSTLARLYEELRDISYMDRTMRASKAVNGEPRPFNRDWLFAWEWYTSIVDIFKSTGKFKVLPSELQTGVLLYLKYGNHALFSDYEKLLRASIKRHLHPHVMVKMKAKELWEESRKPSTGVAPLAQLWWESRTVPENLPEQFETVLYHMEQNEPDTLRKILEAYGYQKTHLPYFE